MNATRPRSFGDLLRQYRAAAGLTQEMLADRARMSLAAIGKLERGARQRPYRATIALLADALTLSADDRLELERAAHRGALLSPSTQGAATAINLPAYFSSFVGRERDLVTIRDMLAAYRLVTLVGAGGVGKTRLAVRAAEQFIGANQTADRFDGVWFVDFSAIADDTMIAMALASSIGVDGGTTIDALVAYLRTQTFLLILDNCEHLLDPIARTIKTLVSQCPAARILATSRQALSVDGERIYHVPPLTLADAVRLFKDRAEGIDSRFELTDSVAGAVNEICKRVDGIALGIELAAARTNAFSPASIAEQIGEHLSLLAGGVRTSLPRHQAIRSLFDWSYDLLDDRERELFRRASIFAGGFTLDLVCALYAQGHEKREIPIVLGSLVDKSLVQSDIHLDPTRYRLLEPLRQYAHELLCQRQEYGAASRSHALAMLALAEDFDSRLELTSDREWDACIERERDNFRAAFEWSLGPRGDTALAQRLAASKTASWNGFKSGEIRRWMNAALETRDETTPPDMLAKLAMSAARTAVIFGPTWQPGSDPEARVTACRYALSLQPAGDLRAVATAQYWLGVALQIMGRYVEAESVLREARTTALAVGAQGEYNTATTTLGSVRYGAGDLQEARELISEVLRRCEDAGSDRVAADARAALAEIEFASGHTQRAVELSETTTQFFRSRSNLIALPMTLVNSAAYLVALGRYQEARDAARETLRRSQAMGSAHSAFWAMQHLAAIGVFTAKQADDDDAFRRAATLLGFVDESTARREIPRYYTEQQEYDKMLGVLRDVLGNDELTKLMHAGKAWSQEQALAESLTF